MDDEISPLNDISVIETELLLSDLSKAENIYENFKKIKGKKTDENIISLYEKVVKNLNDGKLLRDCSFSNSEIKILKEFNLLTLNLKYMFVMLMKTLFLKEMIWQTSRGFCEN